MSTPTINPAMQAALNQMQDLAGQAAGAVPRAGGQNLDTTVGSGGFSEALQSSLERINQMQTDAGDKAKAFQAGEPGVAPPRPQNNPPQNNNPPGGGGPKGT
ncbi:MAG TPA: hypothetical protein DIW42_06905, partial [Alcanivorax sp.]|nr:hypothetical protein [Alcanivorax sp.]